MMQSSSPTTTRWADRPGKVVEVRLDFDGDGNADAVYAISYADMGRVVRVAFDEPADGFVDRIEITTHDTSGHVLTFGEDFDDDGNPEFVQQYTYDVDGNMTREEVDLDGGGAIDRIETFTYDEFGNILTHLTDDDADGVPESTETIVWDTRRLRVSQNALPLVASRRSLRQDWKNETSRNRRCAGHARLRPQGLKIHGPGTARRRVNQRDPRVGAVWRAV